MMSDKMKLCADMILLDAIEDMASEEHISIADARQKLVSSDAYDALYDPKTELWQEGPDFFRYFYIMQKQQKS
ncbi:MAG: hypothetical protein IKY83_08815 [Proteobacteria bacterium]|nr:hypothetical protein [Pseudomonadota bacterium]